MCIWEREEAELTDISETERAFFIRAAADAREAVEAAFPEGRSLTVEGREKDFGFLTAVMKEKDFEERYSGLGDRVLNRIRIA